MLKTMNKLILMLGNRSYYLMCCCCSSSSPILFIFTFVAFPDDFPDTFAMTGPVSCIRLEIAASFFFVGSHVLWLPIFQSKFLIYHRFPLPTFPTNWTNCFCFVSFQPIELQCHIQLTWPVLILVHISSSLFSFTSLVLRVSINRQLNELIARYAFSRFRTIHKRQIMPLYETVGLGFWTFALCGPAVSDGRLKFFRFITCLPIDFVVAVVVFKSQHITAMISSWYIKCSAVAEDQL